MKDYVCESCGIDFDSISSLSNHKRYCNLTKLDVENIVNDYCQNGLSLRKIAEKYNAKNIVWRIFEKYKIKTRNSSEGMKLAHELYPEKFKHSEETKEKIRLKRFEFLKKQTGQTAWERKNQRKMSYIEQWFYDNVILSHQLEKKYDIVNEYSEYPYFIDFAFINIKLAVELDGKFHGEEERKKFDKNRDEKLIEKGWMVYRIPYYKIQYENDETIKSFLIFLNNIKNFQPKIYGEYLLKYSEFKEKRKNNN